MIRNVGTAVILRQNTIAEEDAPPAACRLWRMSPDLPAPIFERTLQLLRELTSISSPSGDLPGLRRMAERLSVELAARGFTPEVREEAGEPVFVARGADTSHGHLLLIGHMDTVLPAAEPRVEGDRLFATGAIDMKGGLAA